MGKYYVGYKWKDEWVIVDGNRGCPFFFLRGCPPLHWLRRVESGGYEPVGYEVTQKVMTNRSRRYIYNKFWVDSCKGQYFNVASFFGNSYRMFQLEYGNIHRVFERQFFNNRRF